ncbi:MAG: hypothetical protein Q8M05_13115 [Rhodoferax sp.]|uniref:hypothetical protein n=2 Tax=Rhodoferax sp. TaxID=50421 RepID=UPI00272EE9A1|nr:hypothetical protein [Rhodoferax sp.]MDP1530315.1 hypothetical protein [Rhodoferax sp.]MDP1943338.1 hypothetical protein [Rhodoferax sp.]
MDMKKLVLLAVAQVAKGTPGTPVPGTNAILCRGFTPQPIEGQVAERNLIKGAKGNYGGIFHGEHRVFEFEVELAGSGAAGTAPKFSPFLLGSATSETITAVTSAAYQPTDGVGSYITLLGYLDGVLFRMTDALGTVSWTLNSEEIPVQKFTFTGTYEAMTDVTLPTGMVYTGFTKPLTVGKVNTPTFTLDGLALTVKSFGMDLGNQVSWRNWIGNSGARNPDRKPTASGVFELTSVATKDWGEACRLGTEMPLVLEHGTIAGNICRLAAPKLQINAKPSITDDNGTVLLSCSFDVKPNAGNDELVWTFK